MTEAVTSLAPDAPENAPKAMPLSQAPERTLDQVVTNPDGIHFAPAGTPADLSKQLSSLQSCRTFGEKVESGVFDWGINFGVNLVGSAIFTHYVKHSSAPIWKDAPFGKNFFGKTPENAYTFVRNGIMNKLKVNQDVASRMADALTLTSGGHLIMIPSVWLGSKGKPGMVEAIDNWYYGADAAANDPWIQQRHEAVKEEAKPTFVGTLIGRAGTVAAVQITSATLGAHNNAISYLGKKTGSRLLEGFKGLDHVAGKFGHAFGEGFQDAMPTFSKKVDAFAQRHNLRFSTEQLQANPKLVGKPYQGAIADYSKYKSLDVLYTGVTMYSIRPIIKAAERCLPGMTYQDHVAETPDAKTDHIVSHGRISNPELSQGVSA